MSCSERKLPKLTLWLAFACLPATAAEHLVGIGSEFDSEGSKAFSVFGSFAIGEEQFLNATALRSNSEGELFDLDTVYFDVGYDHYFEPLGLRVGAAYWGDPDLLDSTDLQAALYWRNDRASLSVDAERRAFDLSVQSVFSVDARQFEFDGDGFGGSLRFGVTDDISVYASGMQYDYSRNIAVQPNIDVLRIFALSSLSTVNSLIDERLSGGIEFNVGSRVIDLRAASWTTAVFRDQVDSLGIGFLTPLGRSSDIEFRLAFDDSESAGRATLLSFFLYLYGE